MTCRKTEYFYLVFRSELPLMPKCHQLKVILGPLEAEPSKPRSCALSKQDNAKLSMAVGSRAQADSNSGDLKSRNGPPVRMWLMKIR